MDYLAAGLIALPPRVLARQAADVGAAERERGRARRVEAG